jgi:hypothetical protein
LNIKEKFDFNDNIIECSIIFLTERYDKLIPFNSLKYNDLSITKESESEL